MSGEHRCAAVDCPEMIAGGHLMCKPHWWSLPSGIRGEVNRAWGRFKYEPDAYRRARDKAISYIADRARAKQGSMF